MRRHGYHRFIFLSLIFLLFSVPTLLALFRCVDSARSVALPDLAEVRETFIASPELWLGATVGHDHSLFRRPARGRLEPTFDRQKKWVPMHKISPRR